MISRITISDLFFNSKEADDIVFDGNYVDDDLKVLVSAEMFLNNYPELKLYISAHELANDYLNRV